jgi:alpha-L-rhamnosidase
LGELQQASGVMPHPDGDISVSLQRKGKEGIEAQVNLPGKLTGEFVWKGKTIKLTGGIQRINL